jgi:hypothetical protein
MELKPKKASRFIETPIERSLSSSWAEAPKGKATTSSKQRMFKKNDLVFITQLGLN